MKYCSNCGAPVSMRVPIHDNRLRYLCDACDTVHYVNPKIVAGCIPEFDDRILLCRRAIKPRYGCWTLPAGFMEMGETTVEAAVRETWEEAQAAVEVDSLFALFSIPHISQVYIMFRARLLRDEYSPGTESLEVALFREKEIPWSELAFPVISRTLEYYFSDKRNGAFQVHFGDILDRTPQQPLADPPA
uniref:ADP-ribose pyrophosphatase YjhB, NUDIX family n=1 Tax=Candidatus Kentrum sp. TUN TaxID=2126343 RepID=A0A450ZSK5_9GAMM|nr:MAG: ADP-ribose pyrophosphatase YjhB, NUDIX family [Candidatus Kentron sp. TUN]VFK58534.1 MAG: ADP-ribose pyrophosphatase YjhB, NUDIX family [Candidatus Kentron sp. TUN]VFK67384.1 MAG: ADP-ribose pyrophosphatase YjhB, NUDIX family [Candidatus Kentron sp. TUN]